MNSRDLISLGVKSEKRLMQYLCKCGYLVQGFGQGALPYEFQEALRNVDDYWRASLFRYLPDLLVTPDPRYAKGKAMLLDAKTTTEGRNNTGNIAIEKAAIELAEIFVEDIHIPTLFVIDGTAWGALTPEEARRRGQHREHREGSGDAFYLIEKRYLRSLHEFLPNLTGYKENPLKLEFDQSTDGGLEWFTAEDR